MAEFQKAQLALCKAKVYTQYRGEIGYQGEDKIVVDHPMPPNDNQRVLVRDEFPYDPIKVILLGINTLPVGNRVARVHDTGLFPYPEPPSFSTRKRVRVWMVANWDGGSKRYRKPFACLEEDLLFIQE